MHESLKPLISDNFILKLSGIGFPDGLRSVLEGLEEVQSVRTLLSKGKLVREDLEQFLDELFKDFTEGEHFYYDFSIAALAVALQDSGTGFELEFLEELAQIHITEMPMSPRVARLLLTN